MLQKILFKIPQGQIIGLISINDASITTIIKMFTTLLDNDEG